VSDHLDKDFLAAFAKIKQRDASIYDPDSKLFDEEGSADEGEDGDAGDGDSGETRPVRKKALRQVLAEQVLPLPTAVSWLGAACLAAFTSLGLRGCAGALQGTSHTCRLHCSVRGRGGCCIGKGTEILKPCL